MNLLQDDEQTLGVREDNRLKTKERDRGQNRI